MKTSIVTLSILISVQFSYPQGIVYNDTIDFENSVNSLTINNGSNNIWQIGVPNKMFFDSAYSKPFAIVTDTINYYPVNNYSEFIVKFEPDVLSYPPVDTYLKFWHKLDTDTLNDFGKVEVSYDGGAMWNILAADSNYIVGHGRWDENLSTYNTQPPDLYSGKSNGWYLEQYTWIWYLPVKTGFSSTWPDSIWIKFSFSSDSVQTNKEGWMIDDITIVSDFYSEIKDFVRLTKSIVYPNPANSSLTIETKAYDQLQLIIYDYSGRQRATHQLAEPKSLINTTEFKNGIYFYQLINAEDGRVSTGKFIIEK